MISVFLSFVSCFSFSYLIHTSFGIFNTLFSSPFSCLLCLMFLFIYFFFSVFLLLFFFNLSISLSFARGIYLQKISLNTFQICWPSSFGLSCHRQQEDPHSREQAALGRLLGFVDIPSCMPLCADGEEKQINQANCM